MANIKFTEFPSAATVGAMDIIPIVQDGANKKATAAVFATYMGTLFVNLNGSQTLTGSKTFSSPIISSVVTGTAPFTVASTTKVTNLNADLLDGLSSAAFQSALTLTTTGTSGAATLVGATLNIPNYGTALANYLPLAGGTLTGALGGTSASFSGAISANDLLTINYSDISTGADRGLRIVNTDPTEGTAYNITSGRTGQNNGDFVIRNTTTGVNNLFFNRTTGAATFSSSVTAGGNLTITGSSNLGNEATNVTAGGYTTRISGASLLSSGLYYGSYGNLILNANNEYTASAKRFMLTNALNATKFAIVRSTNATTDPSFSADGVLASGTADFVINPSGNIGIGTTVDAGYKLDVNGNERIKASGVSPILYVYGGGDSVGTNSGKGNIRSGDAVQLNYFDFGRDNLNTGNFVITSNNSSPLLSITTGGAATFSSSVTATQGILSQSNASGITSNLILENFISTNPGSGNGVAIDFKLNNSGNPSALMGKISLVNTFYRSNSDMIFSVALSDTLSERMRLVSTGQLAIGTATPDASAKVQIDSTTQGFLVPRMSEAEINSISSPAEALLVYNTDQKVHCFYDGANWKKYSHSNM